MNFDAIVFDLGNTLVPWTQEQSRALYAELHKTFEKACGPMPDFFERTAVARERLERNDEMREVTIEEYVDAICDGDAPDGLADSMAATTNQVFLNIARFPDYVPGLLDELGKDRPLAILSNFYMTKPIEQVLKEAGLWDKFVHVEVSATHGFAKPHPAPFDTVREKLGVPMERILMVGDSFWADIVGGHRAGFLTALTHEHRQDKTSDERAPGVQADRIINDLRELL